MTLLMSVDEASTTVIEVVTLLFAGAAGAGFAMLGKLTAQFAEHNAKSPSLRDHYAMAAMQTVLSSDPAVLWEDPDGHKKAMKQIFAWADAMIEARKMQ